MGKKYEMSKTKMFDLRMSNVANSNVDYDVQPLVDAVDDMQALIYGIDDEFGIGYTADHPELLIALIKALSVNKQVRMKFELKANNRR